MALGLLEEGIQGGLGGKRRHEEHAVSLGKDKVGAAVLGRQQQRRRVADEGRHLCARHRDHGVDDGDLAAARRGVGPARHMRARLRQPATLTRVIEDRPNEHV